MCVCLRTKQKHIILTMTSLPPLPSSFPPRLVMCSRIGWDLIGCLELGDVSRSDASRRAWDISSMAQVILDARRRQKGGQAGRGNI